MNGIINIYKEKGFTSHDVVAIVRKTLNTKKVGHTGTLDPDAEGVLPVCIGKATKLADYIMAAEKQYLAEVTFGVTTTTEDASGSVLEVRTVDYDQVKIENTVAGFIGEQEQVPPMYSAIKIKGKKLYELAREGKEVERKSRKITIYNIEVKAFLPPDKLEILVDCSKGTYIRTLCKDLGEALGCGAHMSRLLRTKSGRFTLDNAVKLEELKEAVHSGKTEEVLLAMEEALTDYPKVFVLPKGDKMLYNGGKIYESYLKELPKGVALNDLVAAYDSNEKLAGLFTVIESQEKDKGKRGIKPVKILLD